MKRTRFFLLAGFLSIIGMGSVWAATHGEMMDMSTMRQEMQNIVKEPNQAKRQVLLNEHMARMQPQMEQCQRMMGSNAGMPMMDHSKMPMQ